MIDSKNRWRKFKAAGPHQGSLRTNSPLIVDQFVEVVTGFMMKLGVQPNSSNEVRVTEGGVDP